MEDKQVYRWFLNVTVRKLNRYIIVSSISPMLEMYALKCRFIWKIYINYLNASEGSHAQLLRNIESQAKTISRKDSALHLVVAPLMFPLLVAPVPPLSELHLLDADLHPKYSQTQSYEVLRSSDDRQVA
jgi:hypothetical protein